MTQRENFKLSADVRSVIDSFLESESFIYYASKSKFRNIVFPTYFRFRHTDPYTISKNEKMSSSEVELASVLWFMMGNLKKAFECRASLDSESNYNSVAMRLDFDSWRDQGIDADFLTLKDPDHMIYLGDLISILESEGL